MSEYSETLYQVGDLLDKELKKIVAKGEISSVAELEITDKAASMLMKIDRYDSGMEYDDDGKSGYYPMMRSGHRPYEGEYYGTLRSYRRGDSSMMRRNASGHSINDRMIARLEAMYDEAESDHERKKIDEEIERIRAGK